MRDFFIAVLPNRDGWVPIITKDPVDGELKDTRWFHWPKELDEMVGHAEKYAYEDVYFSPMLYSEPKSRRSRSHAAKANVIAACTVYADGDTADPGVYKVTPTVNVSTSEGRWHNYWRLTDTEDPRTIEELSHAISEEHKDDGVDNGWALSKRLRVPGTSNTNRLPAYDVTAHFSGEVYTLAEFSRRYHPVPTQEVDLGNLPEEIPAAWQVLDSVEPDPELLNLFQVPPIKDYSKSLYILELKLFRQGCTPVQVFAVAREAACNKFNRPGRTEAELWQHVQATYSAYLREKEAEEQEAATDPQGEDFSPEAVIEERVTKKKQEREERKKAEEHSWEDLELLDPEEYRVIPPASFISEYAEWCLAQSQRSARQYHEAAAFMILATVFSEFGYVRPSFGEVNLNLYMLVLGGTTRSRKSTSLTYMLRIIDGLKNDEFDYELPQDVTPESLTEVLTERPGKSSLFWRDEVQGLFEHVKSGGYLRNLFTMLTNAYDGYVNGMLRRTGNVKRTKRTKTCLNFFGMGILDKVTDVVEDEDFESGYLPRFLWVIDQGEQYSVGSTDVEQYQESVDGELDRQYAKFVADLIRARKFWQNYKRKTTERARIAFTDEAWARWQRFTVDIETAASSHPTRSKVLDPSAQRLGITVLKMSALLAMLDMKHEVEIHHVLTAIKYATKFARYLEFAARQVSMSKQARELEELEEFIWTAGGRVTYKAALRHFKGRKTLREFNELMEWLIEAGSITRSTQAKTLYLEVA